MLFAEVARKTTNQYSIQSFTYYNPVKTSLIRTCTVYSCTHLTKFQLCIEKKAISILEVISPKPCLVYWSTNLAFLMFTILYVSSTRNRERRAINKNKKLSLRVFGKCDAKSCNQRFFQHELFSGHINM